MEIFYIIGHSLGLNFGFHWAQVLAAKKNGVLRLQDGVTAAVLGRLQRFDSGRSVMGQTGPPPIRVVPRQQVGSARGPQSCQLHSGSWSVVQPANRLAVTYGATQYFSLYHFPTRV